MSHRSTVLSWDSSPFRSDPIHFTRHINCTRWRTYGKRKIKKKDKFLYVTAYGFTSNKILLEMWYATAYTWCMKLLTTREVAAKLGVSRRRVQALRLKERFPGAIKMGRDWFIPDTDLKAFKRRRAGRPKKKPGGKKK